MEYTVEEVSPVKKKVTINVAPEEVEAAIAGAVALYRQNAQLDGFRKGKVPAQVIEKRFHDSIYNGAREDLINVHINKVLQETNSEPVGALNITDNNKPLEKGKPYSYSMEFEILPAFDLPGYEGLEVDEEKIEPSGDIIDHMLERMQWERSKLEPVDGAGPGIDGQYANIDFETTLDGKKMEDFSATGFDLEIGPKSAIQEFQDFVKTIPVGHTAEKVIHFPDDFIAPALAGKDANMKVTVHALKERRLPALDDRFAELAGKKDMEELREELAEAYAKGMQILQKAGTQRKLLDMLVKQTDFALPPAMVEMEINLLAGDLIGKAEREGKSIVNSPAELDKLKQDLRPQAEARAREKALLMAIAKKENLEVPTAEVEKEVYRGALKMGLDVNDYYKKMRDTGMIFQLRDNMLTDKAMDLIYERAKVTLVEPEKSGTGAVEENAARPGETGGADESEK